MKRHTTVILIAITPFILLSQLDLGEFLPPARKVYTKYVALKYNGKLLSEEYDPRSECKMSQDTKGTITIGSVYMNDPKGLKGDQVKFMVAIHNIRTNTRWMYTPTAVKEVSVENILAKCEPGDKIVFMLLDQQYSLPYNELELEWAC